jgi:hypothetical protein
MQKLFVPFAAALLFAATADARPPDFGSLRDKFLSDHAEQLFGIRQPLAASSRASISAAEANRDPTALVTLAGGLRAQVVSAAANLAPNVDMIALWPNDFSPTHLIFCNEEGAAQPGVQRVNLADGTVETILTGTVSCDPAKRTPWGTLIVGEENGSSGWVIEILDPLHSTGVLFNRGAGTFSGGVGATNLAVRPAVGRLSFEGIALYPNGAMSRGSGRCARRRNGRRMLIVCYFPEAPVPKSMSGVPSSWAPRSGPAPENASLKFGITTPSSYPLVPGTSRYRPFQYADQPFPDWYCGVVPWYPWLSDITPLLRS